MSMPKPQRILAVVDPTASAQPALERATWLAKHLSAKLELFINDAVLRQTGARATGWNTEATAKARTARLDSHLARLRALAAPLQAQGLDVSVDARWNHPLDEAIVRKATEWGADIVVKDTHYHSTLKRSLLTNTDWSLIRSCPAKLLLVKPNAPAAKPRVVAAIDPMHERDAGAMLDKRILETAASLSTAIGGELHVLHAFDITPVIAASTEAMMMPMALPITEIADAMSAEHTAAVHGLTDAIELPRERVHIPHGGARDQLVSIAETLRADVVVRRSVAQRLAATLHRQHCRGSARPASVRCLDRQSRGARRRLVRYRRAYSLRRSSTGSIANARRAAK
jgi:universal stress protein E